MKFPLCLLLAGLVGCSSSSSPSPSRSSASPEASTAAPKDRPAPPAAPVAKLREVDLWNAYDENALKAEAKYTGKLLEVHGELTVIERDHVGFSVVDGDTKASIVCMIDPAHKAAFAEAKKGKRFAVIGTCKGTEERLGVYMNRVILLLRCRPAQ